MKWLNFNKSYQGMTQEERDEAFEKDVRKYTLYGCATVGFCILLAIAYANYFYKFFEKEEMEPVAEVIDEKAELFKKITFANDYESIEDMALVEREEDLAFGYVFGEDILKVAKSIPEAKVQAHKGFVKWATLLKKAQDNFNSSNAGKVVQYWNNEGYVLEAHHEYRNLYAELEARSRLMVESLNDMQLDSNAGKYYNTIFKNLSSYEQNAELYHLQVIRDSINAKGQIIIGYGVNDIWLAQVYNYENANKDWRKEVFLDEK
ncbi:hypothetical protein ABD91_20425 [Lysinibacillus sphaericus]|uniref:hypothetical protein n=1 Tax=Lysinibacillus sphaericus TaxID=1421 RepID=UPI0018CD0BE9|nr:hypothetical protein [Lysinibacillus sphaericus]MBG9693114.1 hypothetical protein [Lysinibacillus sphaericus]